MGKLLVIIFLTGLLSSGMESFKISEKEYENIDRMLEFGVQMFLNCLDKVKEAAEKLVKDDMLRTNRIAIQGRWNSFKDTANRISVEERGKGEQDDLVIAARTIRRLVLHYKEDGKKIFNTLIVEQNVQLYLPIVNTFKGTIQTAKAKEVWGNLVTNYLPNAPPIESEPLEFLCYLLSTSAAESFLVKVLKFGVEIISQFKKIDFDEVSERIQHGWKHFSDKFYEIMETEKNKEEDELLVVASVAARVIVFYWDRFLNTTETPELEKQYEDISNKLRQQNTENELFEALKPITESETVQEISRLHFEFASDIYFAGLTPVIALYFTSPTRFFRTVRVVGMSAVVNAYPVYENLRERGFFYDMKRFIQRAMDIATALADNEEVRHFRETYFEKYKALREELNQLLREERYNYHFLPPHVRAIGRLLLARLEVLVNKVNEDIDDDTVRLLSMNWARIKDNCIKKLLASGVLTQDQLNEAQRIFEEDALGVYNKYLELTKTLDPKRVQDILKALVKVLVMGFNYIYAPLAQTQAFLLD